MRRRSYRGLLWAGMFFLAMQGGLAVALESCLLLRDPEDGSRLALLHRRYRANPRIGLALGTSRTANGLCTDDLSAGPAQMFNYGITGSDLPEQALRLRRLLSTGIRPHELYVEILPAHLARPAAESAGKAERLGGRELRLLWRYGVPRGVALWGHIQSRLVPWYSARAVLLSRWLPWLLPDMQRACGMWEGVSESGWRAYGRERVSDAEYARGLAAARGRFHDALAAFRIGPGPERALRDILALCRHEQIAVTLYLMPEAGPFRAWYPPRAQRVLADYLEGLRREWEVRVIDARAWLPDDAFADGHHLLPHGARAFTARFARAVKGRPPD